ncbi:MAG: HPr family phosphocarrier protein [Planctomycetaceae bacterium]|nr:HPr family phosphocarrier protein [Planctomycetaceae bacterium]
MSDAESVTRAVTLACRNGLHLTPITALVKKASGFSSDIRIRFNHKVANAKSAMDLMLLGATCGAVLHVEATGEDAADAIDAVDTVLSQE